MQSHSCEECGKTFVTAFQLNKHKLGHSHNNCNKCEAKFAKRRLLVHHLKTVHYISTAEKYYACNFCARKFVKKPSLWGHLTEHTSGDQVVCLKCGDILDDDAAFEEHTEKHRNTAPYTCSRCNEFFLRNQQYLAHLQGHDKYRCKLCKKDFSSKKKLKYHRSSEHDSNTATVRAVKVNKPTKPPTGAKNENFTCIVCLQSYKNEDLFKSHDCSKEAKAKEKKVNARDVTVKLGPGSFKCKFCEFEHRKCSAVVRHARMHKNKKRFVCEQCGSAFNSHYTLKEHRSYVHSDIRKHNCTKCDKSFKAKNALIRHMQSHSETRPHQCPQCHQCYKRATHLRRHIETSHKGEEGRQGGLDEWTDEAREVARTATGQGISATAALAVVTTLDLNMRGEVKKEAKAEKDERVVYEPSQDPGEGGYPVQETRAEAAVYQGEARDGAFLAEGREVTYPGEARGVVTYPAVQAREEATYQGVDPRGYGGVEAEAFQGTEVRSEAVEYTGGEADKAYYRSSYGQAKAGYPADRSRGGYPGERLYSPGQERHYHRQEERYPEQRFARDSQTYLDSVPADLTMATSTRYLSPPHSSPQNCCSHFSLHHLCPLTSFLPQQRREWA